MAAEWMKDPEKLAAAIRKREETRQANLAKGKRRRKSNKKAAIKLLKSLTKKRGPYKKRRKSANVGRIVATLRAQAAAPAPATAGSRGLVDYYANVAAAAIARGELERLISAIAHQLIEAPTSTRQDLILVNWMLQRMRENRQLEPMNGKVTLPTSSDIAALGPKPLLRRATDYRPD